MEEFNIHVNGDLILFFSHQPTIEEVFKGYLVGLIDKNPNNYVIRLTKPCIKHRVDKDLLLSHNASVSIYHV